MNLKESWQGAKKTQNNLAKNRYLTNKSHQSLKRNESGFQFPFSISFQFNKYEFQILFQNIINILNHTTAHNLVCVIADIRIFR